MGRSLGPRPLLELYKLSSESLWFSPKDLAKRLNWTGLRAVRYCNYLCRKGYLNKVLHGVYVETPKLREVAQKILRAIAAKKEELASEK